MLDLLEFLMGWSILFSVIITTIIMAAYPPYKFRNKDTWLKEILREE